MGGAWIYMANNYSFLHATNKTFKHMTLQCLITPFSFLSEEQHAGGVTPPLISGQFRLHLTNSEACRGPRLSLSAAPYQQSLSWGPLWHCAGDYCTIALTPKPSRPITISGCTLCVSVWFHGLPPHALEHVQNGSVSKSDDWTENILHSAGTCTDILGGRSSSEKKGTSHNHLLKKNVKQKM